MTQTISQNVGDLTSTIDIPTIQKIGYLGINIYDDGLSNLNKLVTSDTVSKELTEDDVKNEIDCIISRLAELIDIIIKNGW